MPYKLHYIKLLDDHVERAKLSRKFQVYRYKFHQSRHHEKKGTWFAGQQQDTLACFPRVTFSVHTCFKIRISRNSEPLTGNNA